MSCRSGYHGPWVVLGPWTNSLFLHRLPLWHEPRRDSCLYLSTHVGTSPGSSARRPREPRLHLERSRACRTRVLGVPEGVRISTVHLGTLTGLPFYSEDRTSLDRGHPSTWFYSCRHVVIFLFGCRFGDVLLGSPTVPGSGSLSLSVFKSSHGLRPLRLTSNHRLSSLLSSDPFSFYRSWTTSRIPLVHRPPVVTRLVRCGRSTYAPTPQESYSYSGLRLGSLS